jgi:hypothetical protein
MQKLSEQAPGDLLVEKYLGRNIWN